jgi:hypothetical protein
MTIFIQPEHLPVIERLAASDPSETIRKRVRLLLLYEAGMKASEIAEKVDLSPGRVLYWRRQYLKDGLGVFGDAINDLSDGNEEAWSGKKDKPPSLSKLARAARQASKNGDPIEGPRKALAAGIKRADKRRKKLKKRMRGMSKKKASHARDRMKKLNRRIKRAKKILKKLR